MLLRLRLHALLGRNYQHDSIYTARPGEHVANEEFVAWHVDETELHLGAVIERYLGRGKTEIDSNAASLFFWKAIRINSREGAHEYGLPVIDMTSRPNNNGPFCVDHCGPAKFFNCAASVPSNS